MTPAACSAPTAATSCCGTASATDSGRRGVEHPADLLDFEMAFGEGLSTQAILAQRTIWVDDYATSEYRAPALDRYAFGSVICAPLIFRDEPIGALNLHATQGGHRFGPDDADLLAVFAAHAAIAIDHARRFENEVKLGRELADMNAGSAARWSSSSGSPNRCCSTRARRDRRGPCRRPGSPGRDPGSHPTGHRRGVAGWWR